jgi:phospholipid/cholesterol/gamma-HCH transport system substrate-binding protein
MRRAVVIALCVIGAAALVVIPGAVGADDGPYKVRGIFDNGGFIVNGEEVRVAGATVGTVESVDVTGPDETASLEGGPHPVPGKAVVVMNITDDAFKDFREDASCIIRPQSLIGEKLVDCTPTQPRAAGQEPPPELEQIEDGPGEGQYLLPLENNGKAVDIDLIQNINRASYRDRFRLILNDLGAGLAARGDDLGEIVDRANPALRQTNRVLKILADQSDRLASLASDGDAVLQPLAENRTSVTGFFRNAAIAGQATAERGDDLEAQLEKFPETLRQVRSTMKDLRGFADQGTPLMEDIGASAKHVSKATQNLPAFLRAGVPALTSLGDAAEAAGPKLVAADPVVVQTTQLTNKAGPTAKDLSAFLSTMNDTGGFNHLMDFIYNTSGNINGYDQYGHFQRALGIRSNCTDIDAVVFPSCEAFFVRSASSTPTKKKKKKGKSALAPGGSGLAPAAPGQLLPPVEEVIPELDPPAEEEEEPTETTPTEPTDPGDEPDPTEEGDGETPAAAASRTTAADGGRAPDDITMREASLLLQFLLGGSS